MARKKIIIIGAGIAGLSAGCYAQMNGFDSTIKFSGGDCRRILWVEPGGSVPIVAASGRNVIQLICYAEKKPFETSVLEAERVNATS